MAEAIEAVLFDYGLVLTGPPEPAAWAAMRQLLDSEEGPFSLSYWKHRLAYDRGTLTGERYWRAVAADLQRTPDGAGLAKLIDLDTDLWTGPNQPMVDWALRLCASGTPTGILSNLGDSMMHGVLARLPWMRGFTHLTFSHQLGMVKPDRAIYLHAAGGLGVAASRVLFVDDREENIAGALAAGLQAILYGDHALFLHTMRSRGLDALWHSGRLPAPSGAAPG